MSPSRYAPLIDPERDVPDEAPAYSRRWPVALVAVTSLRATETAQAGWYRVPRGPRRGVRRMLEEKLPSAANAASPGAGRVVRVIRPRAKWRCSVLYICG